MATLRVACGAAVLSAIFVLVSADAEARVKFKLYPGNDSFFFHAQIYDAAGSPLTDDMTIEVWNSQGLIYTHFIPAGVCLDRGRSCAYKNREAKVAKDGLVDIRYLYQAKTHGNKIWTSSWGDLSRATEATMTIKILMRGQTFSRTETFKRTHNGWVGF